MVIVNWIELLIFLVTFANAKDIVISGNSSHLLNVTSNRIYVFEGETTTVNRSLAYTITNQSLADKSLIYTCWMDNLQVGVMRNWTDVPLLSSLSEHRGIDVRVNLLAIRLGGSKLYCAIAFKDSNQTIHIIRKDLLAFLIVKRIPTVQEVIFRFVVMFFVIFLTFVMGCGLERKIILNYLKKPVSPAIGFTCQFVFMPLMSLGLAKLTNIDNAFGFGLLTIGCSPGGGASNVWTILFGGDLNLSMTMTFISSCSALFMMPFWLFVLGRFFLDPTIVKVPYQDIGLNLLQVVIPVGFGMLFRWKFETKAVLLAKKVKLMGLLFIIFILTFGSYANLYIFKLMGQYPYLLPIGASLPWLGFIFGALMSVVTRRTKNQTVAIAIETGFQNIGIAVLILKFSMPQPGGDLGAVMPIIVALFTPLPLYFLLIGLTIKKKCCDKKKTKEAEDGEQNGKVEMNSINKEQHDLLVDNKQLLPE